MDKAQIEIEQRKAAWLNNISENVWNDVWYELATADTLVEDIEYNIKDCRKALEDLSSQDPEPPQEYYDILGEINQLNLDLDKARADRIKCFLTYKEVEKTRGTGN